MPTRIIPTQQITPKPGDRLVIDTDRITDALAGRQQPDFLFQVAPAFEDALLLGVDDPGPLVVDALNDLARELGEDAVVVSTVAGDAIDAQALAGASQFEIVAALLKANRRQSIGIYLRAAGSDLEQAARIAALGKPDLGVVQRLANVESAVPFAIRIPYASVEKAIIGRLAGTNGRFSHEGLPCDCGLFHLDSANVGRVSILLTGGGIGGAGAPSPPRGTATPTDTVDTALTCSIAGVALDAQFSLHQRETLTRRSVGGVGRLKVTQDVAVTIEQVFGKNPEAWQKQLAEGSLAQRFLAQLIRPAVAVTRGVRESLGNTATGVLEGFADDLSEGAFGTLAAVLANDIAIPSGIDPDDPPDPIPPAQKLLLDIDSSKVLDDRVDLAGFGRIVPRQPRAIIFGRKLPGGGRTRLEAKAFLIDMRDTAPGDIAWSTPTGTFIGSNIGLTAVVEYEAGESLALAVVARDADLQTAQVDGVAESLGPLFFVVR